MRKKEKMPVLVVTTSATRTPEQEKNNNNEEDEENERRGMFSRLVTRETTVDASTVVEKEEDTIDGWLNGVGDKAPDEQMEVFRLLENRFLQSSSRVIASRVLAKITDLSVSMYPLVRLECFLWARTVDPPEKTLEWLETVILGFLSSLTQVHGMTEPVHISYVLGYIVTLLRAEDLEPVREALTGLCLPLLTEILRNPLTVTEDFRYRTMLDLRVWLSRAAWTEMIRTIWEAESPVAVGIETRLLWSQWLNHHSSSYDAGVFPAMTEKVPVFLESLLTPSPSAEVTAVAPCYVADAATLALDLPQENHLTSLRERAEEVLREYYESGISQVYEQSRTARTFYENKENIHCISLESAQEILDFLVEEFPLRARHRLQYYMDWIDRALVPWTEEIDLGKIHLALYRIDKDWSKHGRLSHRLYDIFQMIVAYIEKFGDKEKDHDRKELERRLLQELEEMSGTCSTGYAIRLLNVLTGYRDFQIRIPPEYALRCRLFQKLNLAISTISGIDPERASRIMDQMTLPASCYDQRTEFLTLFREQLPQAKEELYQEFKDMMTDTDYDLYLRKAIFSYEGYLGGAGADF